MDYVWLFAPCLLLAWLVAGAIQNRKGGEHKGFAFSMQPYWSVWPGELAQRLLKQQCVWQGTGVLTDMRFVLLVD